MKFSFFLYTLFFLFIMAGCMHKQATTINEGEAIEKNFSPTSKPPKPGELFLPLSGTVTLSSLPTIIGNADYILIGETHDNSMHHQVQATLLSILSHNSMRRPILGLEMLPTTMQRSINRFNYGQIDTQKLSEDVDWATTWGFPFSLYLPIFKIANEMGTQVYGLNIDKDALNLARKIGLKKARKQLPKQFPAHVFPPHEAQVAALQSIFEEHVARMKARKKNALSSKLFDKPNREEHNSQKMNNTFARFLLVQSLWDSTMAENAVQLRKKTGKPIIILAGAGHVEEFGIPWRITKLDPKAHIFTILPAVNFSPEAKYEKANLYFYTLPQEGYGLLPQKNNQ